MLKYKGLEFATFVVITKVLLWFFVPVLVFQSLFTPGNYVVSQVAIPFTYEGIEQGLLLCMHLATVYFAAFTVMKLVSYSEWLRMLQLIPYIYQKLLPSIILLHDLKAVITTALQTRYGQWLSLPHKYKELPSMIAETMGEVVSNAENSTADMWQSWDTKVHSINALPAGVKLFRDNDMLYMFPLIAGWVLVWIK